MEEVKHTPGPWVWNAESPTQCGDGSWLKSQSGMVLDYAGCGSHECKVKQADARLIAAAPELLAALQHIMNVVPYGGFAQIHYKSSTWQQLDDAITKAIGLEGLDEGLSFTERK